MSFWKVWRWRSAQWSAFMDGATSVWSFGQYPPRRRAVPDLSRAAERIRAFMAHVEVCERCQDMARERAAKE